MAEINDSSYIQTYDFNTQQVFPIVGIGSIWVGDAESIEGGDPENGPELSAEAKIAKFEEYIANLPSYGYFNSSVNFGSSDKIFYIEKGKEGIITNKGTENKPIYIKEDGEISAINIENCPSTDKGNYYVYWDNGFKCSNVNVGTKNKPIYIKNGKIELCEAVYSLPVASDSSIGGVKVNVELSANNDPNNNRLKIVKHGNEGDIFAELKLATTTHLGGIKSSNVPTKNIDDREYNIYVDNSGIAKVYVPWEDTTLKTASPDKIGGIKTGYNPNGKNYAVKVDDGNAYVNVTWENTTYTIDISGNIVTLKGSDQKDTSIDLSNLEQDLSGYLTKIDASNTYVAIVKNMGLSSNDFTNDLKNKLDGIADGAEVNYVKSVGDNLAVDGAGKLTVDLTNYVSKTKDSTITGTLRATDFIIDSDERIKTFLQDIPVDFDKLKNIPKKYFTFNDDVNKIRIGTSAQKLNEVYPELVNYDEDADRYAVSYATLSVVALAAIDKLYEEIQMLKDKINELENGRG